MDGSRHPVVSRRKLENRTVEDRAIQLHDEGAGYKKKEKPA
jgi:hypothetical protein